MDVSKTYWGNLISQYMHISIIMFTLKTITMLYINYISGKIVKLNKIK